MTVITHFLTQWENADSQSFLNLTDPAAAAGVLLKALGGL